MLRFCVTIHSMAQCTCPYTASKLQRLLVLESEHGPLLGTSPALTDVLHYLNKVMKQLSVQCIMAI